MPDLTPYLDAVRDRLAVVGKFQHQMYLDSTRLLALVEVAQEVVEAAKSVEAGDRAYWLGVHLPIDVGKQLAQLRDALARWQAAVDGMGGT